MMEEINSEETRLCHISSILIPGDEVVISVYDGLSAAAVGRLNERVGILVSRIVDAIALIQD